MDALVERCLRQAMLWDEVKDRLNLLGIDCPVGSSSGSPRPGTLPPPGGPLPDEFSIAIDPVTTMKIEDILRN